MNNLTTIEHTHNTYQCDHCEKEHETDELLVTFHTSDDASIHSPEGHIHVSSSRDQHFCNMKCFIAYLTDELGE